MFDLNVINDSDSIDFDYFENDGKTVKRYLNPSTNNNYCSKIITKAVIETNSRYIDACDQSEEIGVSNNPSRNFEYEEDSHDNIFQQGGNTRVSLGESLFNSTGNSLIIKDSFSILSDDINDNLNLDDSTSDSTITTISSDFTSVSSFSSVSNSSLASDVSLDFPTRPRTNENTGKTDCNFNDAYRPTSKNNNATGKIVPYECQVISEQVQYETNKDEGLNFTSIEPDKPLALTNQCSTNKIINCAPNEIEYYQHCIKQNDFPEHNRQPMLTESIVCATEGELKNLSFSPQSSSTSFSLSTYSMRESSKVQLKRRKFNLTFNREELIKIERDNLTLLKKIMAHSKTRSIMSNNNSFSHKKASAAINRAKQQKKIEQDNYILYSKINAVGRMKNVC